MRCPTCDAEGERVLETRGDGTMVRRRRRCVDGHQWWSVEVPETVLRGFGMAKIEDCIRRFERGRKLRAQAAQRRAIIAEMLDQGATPRQAAKKAGVSVPRVCQIRDELKASRASEVAPAASGPASWLSVLGVR